MGKEGEDFCTEGKEIQWQERKKMEKQQALEQKEYQLFPHSKNGEQVSSGVGRQGELYFNESDPGGFPYRHPHTKKTSLNQ